MLGGGGGGGDGGGGGGGMQSLVAKEINVECGGGGGPFVVPQALPEIRTVFFLSNPPTVLISSDTKGMVDMEDLEKVLDGNLCRCTGSPSRLTANLASNRETKLAAKAA